MYVSEQVTLKCDVLNRAIYTIENSSTWSTQQGYRTGLVFNGYMHARA